MHVGRFVQSRLLKLSSVTIGNKLACHSDLSSHRPSPTFPPKKDIIGQHDVTCIRHIGFRHFSETFRASPNSPNQDVYL